SICQRFLALLLLSYFSFYSLLSITIVTGPSLRKSIFMSAPKIPICTCLFNNADRRFPMWRYKGFALSGFAARIKEGRLPFFVWAINVNCDIRRILPSRSRTDLFIKPASSEKIRRLASFCANHSSSFSVSFSSTPNNTNNPSLMAPVQTLSTVHAACVTRCITARILQIRNKKLYSSSHQQNKRKYIFLKPDI